MNLALGMMLHNDDHWLRLHLPVVAPCFDCLCFGVETQSEIASTYALTSEILPHYTGEIRITANEFHDNWSEMFNHVIDLGEMVPTPSQRQDALIRLDPDEVMFRSDIRTVRDWLEKMDVVVLPRYNFWYDRATLNTEIYPDYQGRAFRLHQGIRLQGKRHEGLDLRDPALRTRYDPDCHIYHYGDIGHDNLLARCLKYINYARVDAGIEPLATLPSDTPIPQKHTKPFEFPQPIDVSRCGLYAPFDK